MQDLIIPTETLSTRPGPLPMPMPTGRDDVLLPSAADAPSMPSPNARADGAGHGTARVAGPRDATFHPSWLRQLIGRLQREGRDVTRVLAAGDLAPDDLERPDRMLPFENVRRVVHAGVLASGRATLAIELGRETQLALLGCLGYALATAPTVGQAVQVVERFGSLRNRAARLVRLTRGDVVRLQVDPGFELGDLRRFVLERSAAALVHGLVSVSARPLTGAVLNVPGPVPVPELRGAWESLGVALAFDAPAFSLDLPVALLDAPTVGGSLPEFGSAWRECEAAERRQRQSLTFTARVNELFELEGPIDLEAAASRLAMSTRTLIRRLRAEDTTFQALREAHRREQALVLLQDRRLTVADIAARLAYVDGSNFSRTFRRWFGATPIEVRLGRVAWPEGEGAVS